MPVGVRTVQTAGVTVEVWYPAPDDAEADEDVDFAQFIPDAVSAVLGDIALPIIPAGVARDVRVRRPVDPYPVLVFSHGIGGTRLQSVDYTVHLASRGYVVLSADHTGRDLPGFLPCLFSPPLEGCDLGGMSGDVALPHVDAMVDWLDRQVDDGFLEGAIDPDRLGLTGHSAGGWTTATAGQENDRFSALLPMAAGGVVTRDVPMLRMAGTCDGVVPFEEVETDQDASVGELAVLDGAGHGAFADICALDLPAVAAESLAPVDDINATLLASLVRLASDGCPGYEPDPPVAPGCSPYADRPDTMRRIRELATTFFDESL